MIMGTKARKRISSSYVSTPVMSDALYRTEGWGRAGEESSGPVPCGPAPQAAPSGQLRRRGALWEGCEQRGTPLARGCTYTRPGRMPGRVGGRESEVAVGEG